MAYLKPQKSENEINSHYFQSKQKLEDSIEKCIKEFFDQSPMPLSSDKSFQELCKHIEVIRLTHTLLSV